MLTLATRKLLARNGMRALRLRLAVMPNERDAPVFTQSERNAITLCTQKIGGRWWATWKLQLSTAILMRKTTQKAQTSLQYDWHGTWITCSERAGRLNIGLDRQECRGRRDGQGSRTHLRRGGTGWTEGKIEEGTEKKRLGCWTVEVAMCRKTSHRMRMYLRQTRANGMMQVQLKQLARNHQNELDAHISSRFVVKSACASWYVNKCEMHTSLVLYFAMLEPSGIYEYLCLYLRPHSGAI